MGRKRELPTLKVRVPKSRIPPLHPLCPQCGKGTKQQHGTAFAEGYHRRHVCRDIRCDYFFYSLTPYEEGDAMISRSPFKDRALTELEQAKRDQWWEQEGEEIERTKTVLVDIPSRMARALRKPEEKHDEIDSYLVGLHEEATREVQRLLLKQEERNE